MHELPLDGDGDDDAGGRRIAVTIPDTLDRIRLDRALAEAAGDPALSRSELARLIAGGAVSGPDGRTLTDTTRKVKPGEVFEIALPPPVDAEPQPEAIPLAVVHEDADLIVVDKPAGMVVHPAPGAQTGTLVNALLAHCGTSLAGIGGERRPGIVHRIDKDTSGLIVAAKTQAAHAGLSALFARHDIERLYRAVAWGMPDRGDPRLAGRPGLTFETGGWLRVETLIGRHPVDRKRMAVVRSGGRKAVTRLRVVESFEYEDAPMSCLLECRLETGRTHQIRVHASHAGHALVGDPVYCRSRRPGRDAGPAGEALAAFPRQALHAAVLGFRHPVTGAELRFESPLPQDMADLVATLRRS